MASAKKLPSGAWRTRATKTVDGKQIRKSFTVHPDECGGDWREAKSLSEMYARNWLFDTKTEDGQITVKKAIQMYIDERSAVLSVSTLADYKRMDKHFSEILDQDALEIDAKTLQAIINRWALDGLRRGTIRNRINFLTAALSFAGNEKRFSLRLPKEIPQQLLPPEPSEFHRLLSAASDEERLMIVLAGLYTLRRGEMGGLCGEDILWDMNAIYIHTSKVQNEQKEWVRREMPKNLSSVRTVHVAPEVMRLFPHVGPKEYIFSLNPNEMTKHFERLRQKTCVNCRLHDLRKYAASIRSEIMPTKYVEADGGWQKGSNVLSTIYDRPFKETRKEYSKKFNEKIVQDYGSELFG